VSQAIDAKTWQTMVARAARAGIVLMKSDGAAPVVVALDRQGQPHRIDTVDALEAVLVAECRPAFAEQN
jgi:hypothetical protein